LVGFCDYDTLRVGDHVAWGGVSKAEGGVVKWRQEGTERLKVAAVRVVEKKRGQR
jgi:hypothetical protein